MDRSLWIHNDSIAGSYKFRFHQYDSDSDPSSMEDNLDMNELEEELSIGERKRSPKVVLAFLSIVILIAAILLGITLSDSNDSPTNSDRSETPPLQEQADPDEQDQIEIEAEANVALSAIEKMNSQKITSLLVARNREINKKIKKVIGVIHLHHCLSRGIK